MQKANPVVRQKGDQTMQTPLIILIGVVGVVAGMIVGAVMLEVYVRWKTTARLRQLFGPEYKRVGDRYSDQHHNWRHGLRMKTQISNIAIVRSAWRRRKKDITGSMTCDLEPLKNVRGGGGFESKSSTGDGDTKVAKKRD